jgi:hypothetical protein
LKAVIGTVVGMEPDLPDDLDQMIAERTEANPDFPAMVEAAAAARAERRAKLKATNEGAPDVTEDEGGGAATSPS